MIYIFFILIFWYFLVNFFNSKNLKINIKPRDIQRIPKKIKNKRKKEIVVDKSDYKYYSELNSLFEKEKSNRNYQNNQNYQILFQPNNYQLNNYQLNNYQRINNGNNIYNGNLNFLDLTTDSQNVHSSLVQDTITKKYAKIRGVSADTNTIDYKESILDYARNCGKDYLQIKTILNEIEKRNSPITNLDSTETRVLNDTWFSANENVKEQILNELLDANSPGYLVCPTGVVSRIINANVVNDLDSSPRTEENLREEMLNTASKIRSLLENDTEYIDSSESKQTEIFKETLIEKYNNDYKDIISEDRIQKELDTWIDHV